MVYSVHSLSPTHDTSKPFPPQAFSPECEVIWRHGTCLPSMYYYIDTINSWLNRQRATFSKLTTFSKFLLATSILKIFPYFKLWYFFSCCSRHMRDFSDIFYVKTIVYDTEHWLQNAWLAYYWTSQAFLATPAFLNFMIYSNVVQYVKSQVSEYSETIRMSTRKYKF